MKESHGKGLTHHPDPESCVARREAVGEALTGAHVGRVLSCEIRVVQSADDVRKSEGHIRRGVRVVRVSRGGTLRSLETPSMHGYSTRENRETPGLPAARSAAGRAAKARGRTAAMHGPGESDGGVLPTNGPNKEGRE